MAGSEKYREAPLKRFRKQRKIFFQPPKKESDSYESPFNLKVKHETAIYLVSNEPNFFSERRGFFYARQFRKRYWPFLCICKELVKHFV
jgi:hypothetical protein